MDPDAERKQVHLGEGKKSSPGLGNALQPVLSAVCHPKVVAPRMAYSTQSPPGDVSPTPPLSRTENTVPNVQNPFFRVPLNGIPANLVSSGVMVVSSDSLLYFRFL